MRLLPGNLVALPSLVRISLERIFDTAAASIDQVRIVEYSLFARLHGRAIATTRRRRIFLRGSAAEFFADPVLMLHEYCHVLLQWETGSLTTLRYLRECLRRGYWNNRFEVEAREFARRREFQLRELLRWGTEPVPKGQSQ
ncbi:MAG: hypothetical protein WBE92_08585 [Steroidobacteraceae bacterium]